MKVINYIRLCNLFSHKDTRIDFEEGKNYIVGSIGKGKTLVLEGIGFALFGSVALRGKAPMYKSASVELSFNYKNEVFLINRKINDASLSIYSKELKDFEVICTSTTNVNQHIINLLGYNYDVFLLSNYCKQKKLSYFSELTPAKRHSYIDKISGLEESNKVLSFIASQRKNINSQINTLKDMVVKPEISSNVDLEFNYDGAIDNITNSLNSLTDMYSDYTDLQNRITSLNVTEPQLHLTELETYFNSCDNKEDVINICNQVQELDYQCNLLDNKIRDLPKIKPKYKNYSLEDIEKEIHKHNISFINHLPDDFNIDCPHCNQNINLPSVLSKSEYESSTIPVKDLYDVKEYLEQDIKKIERDLNRQLKEKEKQSEDLSSNVPSYILNQSSKSINLIVNTLDKKLKEYNSKLIEYKTNISKKEQLVLEADNLKQQIDSFLLEQKELIVTKDSYLKANTEKKIYLERLSIYETAYSKYSKLLTELELFNNLKKSVNEIVTNIQNNIIPLIDYHASIFIDLITKGSMSKIEITEDYDILVDSVSINLKSGGQQDLASLAFRLSLGQSVVTGMLPLFIGDEIDSAGTSEVSDDITTALDSISNSGFQVILITHQDISTIENANIIQL